MITPRMTKLELTLMAALVATATLLALSMRSTMLWIAEAKGEM